jgi:hypothetical protein
MHSPHGDAQGPVGTKHLSIKPLRDRVGLTFNIENAAANQRDRGMRPGDPPSLSVEPWKVKPMRRLGRRDEIDRRVRKTASFSGSNPISTLAWSAAFSICDALASVATTLAKRSAKRNRELPAPASAIEREIQTGRR